METDFLRQFANRRTRPQATEGASYLGTMPPAQETQPWMNSAGAGDFTMPGRGYLDESQYGMGIPPPGEEPKKKGIDIVGMIMQFLQGMGGSGNK